MTMNSLQTAIVEFLRGFTNERFTEVAAKLTIFAYTKPLEKDVAPRREPLLGRHGSVSAFLDSVQAGEAASLVAAVELLAEIEPGAIEAAAIDALSERPWPTLANALTALLGRCSSKASFLALVSANTPGGRHLRDNRYANGCEYIHSFLKEDPLLRDYPRLEQPTLFRWNSMNQQERDAWTQHAAQLVEGYTFDDLNLRQTFLYYTGERRCPVSLEWLRTVWTTHPAKVIRLGAGFALLDLSSRGEMALLAEHLFSVDRPIHSPALVALILEEPKTAAARLRTHMTRANFVWAAPENSLFTSAVLGTLGGHPRDSKDCPWLLQDEEWIDLLLELMPLNNRRQQASEFLARFPRDTVKARQAKVTSRDVAPKQGALRDGSSLLEHFEAGGEAEAWAQICVLGAAVREPQIRPFAERIATETMKRVRVALETLAARLEKSGYVFLNSPLDTVDESVLSPRVAKLEQRCGPLPLGVKAMYLHVGGCDFRGYHPDWPVSNTRQPGFEPRSGRVEWYTDPLVLSNAEEALEVSESSAGDIVSVALSGDAVAKAGFSGGQYIMVFPDPTADGVLEGEPKQRRLVEYLRHSIRNGGFAGFDAISNPPQTFLDELTRGLGAF